jgi:hypothetical protein
MTLVIVPDALREEIYRRIDAKLADWPDAVAERENFYQALLFHFDAHGVIPDFDIALVMPKLVLERVDSTVEGVE